MKKDKITIGYILITVMLLVFTAVYLADLDFKQMNSNIEKGSVNVIESGKHYSDKLYTMVSNEWQDLNQDVIVFKPKTKKIKDVNMTITTKSMVSSKTRLKEIK